MGRRPSARASISSVLSPARTVAARIDPAEVPTTIDALRGISAGRLFQRRQGTGVEGTSDDSAGAQDQPDPGRRLSYLGPSRSWRSIQVSWTASSASVNEPSMR